jgi:hypothetical protein
MPEGHQMSATTRTPTWQKARAYGTTLVARDYDPKHDLDGFFAHCHTKILGGVSYVDPEADGIWKRNSSHAVMVALLRRNLETSVHPRKAVWA